MAMITIIQFVSFQHQNYVVVISISFDKKEKGKNNSERNIWEKGCDLSLNHDIVSVVTPKSVRN